MPSCIRSNKETQLLFSPDPASLECSIRKEARSSSIDNTTCSSIDFCQPPSTHTLVPSTDTRSPLSTDDTHLSSTDIFHPPSIDTSVRTSIDTEPRDMVATLILVRDDRGTCMTRWVICEEKRQEGDFEVESLMSFGRSHWCRSTPSHEHRSTEVIQNRSTSSPVYRSTTPTESTASCKAVRIMTHEEFAAKHPHPPSLVYMPKIDVACLNALRPKPKPSENPPETVKTPSDDGVDPMEVDRVPTGRTLRRRNEKVAKHLKRRANEKENESFQKRVFMIPLDKPFDEAYYTHRLRINDPGIIAACHCGAEDETEYSASIETHTATSIDSAQQKLTNAEGEESFDIRQGEWENDYYIPTMATHTMHIEEYDEYYEEERAIEQKGTLDKEDRLLYHSSWKTKSPSIDRYGSTSIDTKPHQPNHLRASTDNNYFPSIDTNVDATRHKDYSVGSWADDRYHESYAVERTYCDQGDDELHEGFTYEELLNMQRRDETYQNRAEAA
ncbi:hypothetical protein F2Q70_00003817 [Brassica cretica]|uniref:Uncharacterized protein n=1 Tax=Brassica cretica TaxID=69181 RepID=A0A8S9IPI7_BRACR|nr:hypothetical protein F2Q70_00003817 [Brassica cretica]